MESTRGRDSLPVLVGMVTLAGIAAISRAAIPLLNGPDPFWHRDLGRRIVTSGLPRTDPYSFLTDGRDWVLNQWGADAIFGVVDAVGGLSLLALFAALLVGGGVGLMGWQMWKRSASLTSVALLALVVMASINNWSLRGNLFTFLLLPLLLSELHRTRPRPWFLLVLLIAWANLHATFIVGVGLGALSAGSRLVVAPSADRRSRARDLATILGVGVLAAFVTPYGPRFLISIVELVARSGANPIVEWAPPNLTAPMVLPFTVLVLVVLVGMGVSCRRDDLPDITLIVAGTLLGLTAARNVAPAAIIVGVVGAPHVQGAWAQLRHRAPVGPGTTDRRSSTLTALIAGAFLVPTIAVVPWTAHMDAHVDRTPLAAATALDAVERDVRVITPSSWAPAIAALTGPQVRTAVDGRIELFTAQEFSQLQTVLGAGHGWQNILASWCVTDAVILTNSGLHQALTADGGWTQESEFPIVRRPDSSATWLTRDNPAAGCPADRSP